MQFQTSDGFPIASLRAEIIAMNTNKPAADSNRPEPARQDMTSWKPGSESDPAQQPDAPGDFGVHASRSSAGDRAYTSRNAKLSDPGNAQPWSRENADGDRTAGAAGHASGVGSSSGGDLDPDLIGVGTGGSMIAQSGPGNRPGEDDTDGSSDEFATGGHATGRVPPDADRFSGSSYTGELPAGPVGGADNAVNPAREDDSFAGEVSSGEASGQDNPIGGNDR